MVGSSPMKSCIPLSRYLLQNERSSLNFCSVIFIQHYKQDEQYTDILMYLNIAFTVLYMIEAGLKFFALRLVTILEIICFVYMEEFLRNFWPNSIAIFFYYQNCMLFILMYTVYSNKSNKSTLSLGRTWRRIIEEPRDHSSARVQFKVITFLAKKWLLCT